MARITNIHDSFFKQMFSDVANVRALLEIVLPPAVLQELELSHLQLEPTTYVSEEYRTSLSDLVIRTRTRQKQEPVDIYFLFEHKSYPYKGTLSQLHRYQFQTWQQDERAGRPLRVIIPVVLYHGKRRWNLPTRFAEQFKAPDPLRRYLLDFEYILFDTHDWDWKAAESQAAREQLFVLTVLLLMKAAAEEDLTIIRRVLELWRDIGVIRERELFLFGMIYIVETQNVKLEDLAELLEESQIEGEEIMPTLAQRLREEGYKEGIQKGIQEGIQKGIQEGIQKGIQEGIQKGIERGKQEGALLERQHVLVMLLSMRFPLTEAEKKLIYSVKDGQRLEEAIKMILTATDKAEILNKLSSGNDDS